MLIPFLLLSLVQSKCDFPVMSIGTFNITSERQLKDIIKKEPIFLLGLTSKDCDYCCKHETIYNAFMDKASKYTPKIQLMRHDVSSSSFIKKYIPVIEKLPQLYGVHKGVFYEYHDLIDASKILRFADKLISPISHIEKLEEVLEFLKPPTGGFQTLKVLGLLTDSDTLEDYKNAVIPIANWFSSEFRVVTDKLIIKEIRTKFPEINQMNTLILMRVDDTKYLDLELPQDIKSWIVSNANGLVEELTPYNFQMYALNPAPMLIMFIDPKNINSPLHLDEFKKSARKFAGDIKYVWVNATNPNFIDKRLKLGLNTEILPSLAFNLKNMINYPMEEGIEIIEKNIDSFVQGFVDGKKNNYPESFQFNGVKLENCKQVNSSEFEKEVFNEGQSLVIIYSSHLSKETQKFANVFNRVCKRFRELEVEGLNVVAFDAAIYKAHEKVNTGKIPAVYFRGLGNQLEKWTGGNTALEIMKFVEGKMGIRLPELPHLDEREKDELRKSQKEAEARRDLKEEL